MHSDLLNPVFIRWQVEVNWRRWTDTYQDQMVTLVKKIFTIFCGRVNLLMVKELYRSIAADVSDEAEPVEVFRQRSKQTQQ